MGAVAQLVEHWIENPGVGGSTPPGPTTSDRVIMGKWQRGLMHRLAKTAGSLITGSAGSNPAFPALISPRKCEKWLGENTKPLLLKLINPYIRLFVILDRFNRS